MGGFLSCPKFGSPPTSSTGEHLPPCSFSLRFSSEVTNSTNSNQEPTYHLPKTFLVLSTTPPKSLLLTAVATESSPTPTNIRLNILLTLRDAICRFESAGCSVEIHGSGRLSRWRRISKALILFEFSMFTFILLSTLTPKCSLHTRNELDRMRHRC